MPGSRAPTVPAFARRLAIETPEHVALEIELAGPGSRVAAAACDAAILFAVLILLSVGLSVLSPRTGMQSPWGTLVAVLVVLVLFFVTWGYFLLFEALNDGRTPGKRLLGIRVVMDTATASPSRPPPRSIARSRRTWRGAAPTGSIPACSSTWSAW